MLDAAGGMLTLPDAYALFNRARGLEVGVSSIHCPPHARVGAESAPRLTRQLISPDDLLEASRLLAPLGLPMALREVSARIQTGRQPCTSHHVPTRCAQFGSGVRVIQQAAFDDSAVARRLAAAARDATAGIGGLEAAGMLHVSVTLALEYLVMAEARGLLCRDDAIEGLRFYPNRFVEYSRYM